MRSPYTWCDLLAVLPLPVRIIVGIPIPTMEDTAY